MVNPEKATAKKEETSKPTLKPKFPIGEVLKKFLSPPQNVIGIDIGSSYIKVAQLQKSSSGYMLLNCITRALPSNVKDNPAEKKKVVQEFLKNFIADSRKKTHLGRIAIFGKGVFIISLAVPSLKKKDLKGAISIELKKRMPFQTDMNNVFFDFFITGQTTDETGNSLQVTCIAVDNARLDEQVQFVKEIDIKPMAINVIPDALGNLLPFCVDAPATKVVAVLDLGASNALLNFYKSKDLIFSREIPVGSEQFTLAMAKGIINPATGAGISLDEAEKIKRNCGLPLEDEAKIEHFTDYGPLRGEQISTMLRPALERLAVEISRTLSYFTKTFKAPNIEELYLTGGGSRLRNIDKFFLYNLQGLKKIESLNTLKAVKGWAETGIFKQELVMEQASPHLSVAFGLCLGSGGKVNLLPLKEKIEQKAIVFSALIRVFFPILLTLILIYYGVIYGNALHYNVLISKMDKGINSLEPTVRSVKEYTEIKAKLDQRKLLLEKAKGKEPMWWGILKELSNITPKDVILKKVSNVDLEGVKAIEITGKIFAKYTIVDLALQQYVITLDDSPFFTSAELVSSKQDLYSPIPAADFVIVCKINY